MINNHERYESLGTNCEFGFVLRSVGSTTGGFFKWAETPARSALKILENGLRDQYRYENLVPLYQNMVWDTVYDIGFHSKMHSTNKQWTQSEGERRAVYEQELERQNFLINRFLERLQSRDTVFLLKEDAEPDASLAGDIARALRALGGEHLLAIRKTTDASLVGEVEDHDTFKVGYIDRFAPISSASDFSSAWEHTLNNFDKQFTPEDLR